MINRTVALIAPYYHVLQRLNCVAEAKGVLHATENHLQIPSERHQLCQRGPLCGEINAKLRINVLKNE